MPVLHRSNEFRSPGLHWVIVPPRVIGETDTHRTASRDTRNQYGRMQAGGAASGHIYGSIRIIGLELGLGLRLGGGLGLELIRVRVRDRVRVRTIFERRSRDRTPVAVL